MFGAYWGQSDDNLSEFSIPGSFHMHVVPASGSPEGCSNVPVETVAHFQSEVKSQSVLQTTETRHYQMFLLWTG